eukprot:1493241-Prymnesium_polylepis.2
MKPRVAAAARGRAIDHAAVASPGKRPGVRAPERWAAGWDVGQFVRAASSGGAGLRLRQVWGTPGGGACGGASEGQSAGTPAHARMAMYWCSIAFHVQPRANSSACSPRSAGATWSKPRAAGARLTSKGRMPEGACTLRPSHGA